MMNMILMKRQKGKGTLFLSTLMVIFFMAMVCGAAYAQAKANAKASKKSEGKEPRRSGEGDEKPLRIRESKGTDEADKKGGKKGTPAGQTGTQAGQTGTQAGQTGTQAGQTGNQSEKKGTKRALPVRDRKSKGKEPRQSGGGGKVLRLSLKRAMKMARKKNLDLKSARLNIKAAEQGVRAAWGGLGPHITVSADFAFMGGDSAFDSDGGDSSSPFCDDFTDPNCISQITTLMCGTSDINDECVQYLATSQGQSTARIVANTLGASMSGFGDIGKIFQANTFTPSITAVWPLFNASSWLGIRQAKLGKHMSTIQVKDKVQDVGLQVQVTFYQILQFKEITELSEASAKSTRAHWQQAKALLAAGSGTTTDVLRWETQMAQDKLDIMKMELAVRQFKMMLNNILGRPLRAGLALIPPPQVTGPLPVPKNIDQRDIERHPQMKLAKAAIKGKHIEYRMAQSKFLPTLTLTANYQWQRYIQYLNAVPDKWLGSWMVGLSLQVPLFDSLIDYHSVRSKSYELRKSRLDARNLRRMLRHQLFSARQDLLSAKQQVKTSRKQVELAVAAHRSAENLYRAGAAKTTDVLDAQIQERQARGNLIKAKYDYLIALTRLERAAGKIRITK